MEFEVYYEKPWARIKFDKQNKILIVEFFTVTEDTNLLPEIDEEEIKEFLLKYVEAFMHYKTPKVLFDYTRLFMPLTDELSQWIIENVVKKTVANGLKKLAQVYPKDIITKLGLEILVEKTLTDAPGPKRMLFEDTDQAYQWLLKE